MTQHDTKPSAPPASALVLLMTILGAVLVIVALVAVLATDPVNWFGIGLAVLAGVYSLVLAQVVKRRAARRD